MRSILNSLVYRKLPTDPTNKIERNTIRLIKKSIPEDTVKKLSPRGTVPPRRYGIPKAHKEDVPLRPIVNCISSPTYGLAKHLVGLLKPLVGNSIHHIRNSDTFIQNDIQLQGKEVLVSFNVSSLFIRVPLEDTLQVFSQHILVEIKDLIRHFLMTTYFLFDGTFYKETDSVAMGSLLAPIVANIYMEKSKQEALSTAKRKATPWYRYVDNTFVIWPHGKETLQDSLHHLDGIHGNIKFTMELEQIETLTFIDVLVKTEMDGMLVYMAYRKTTNTDLYVHEDSEHLPAQKRAVLSTLIHGA
jgi:Reverse transcriptase (RNA-dependent DNA polymerase).